MTDYFVETFETQGTILEVLAALKVEFETIVNTKVIHYIDVRLEGRLWHGIMIYTT